MRYILSLLPIFLIFFSSCNKKPAVKPAGLATTVSGIFYDDINQEPLRGVRIVVGEYEKTFSPYGQAYYRLITYLDSGFTDNDGKYGLTFTTSGKGNAYFVSNLRPLDGSLIITPKVVNDDNFMGGYIDNIGGDNTVNFTVKKQYYMRARVIVHGNPHPPLLSSTGTPKVGIATDRTNIQKADNDTIVNFPIIKNTGGFYLSFSITDPVTRINYRNTPILMDPVIDRDTISVSTLNVYPATFR